jgi:hypothetical protein
MAAMGVMLGLLGVTLQGAIRTSARLQDFEAAAAIMMRLEVQFRTDVHQADQVSLVAKTGSNPPQARLILANGDSDRIEYTFGRDRIAREVFGTDGLVHRDAFHVGRDADVQFQVTDVTPGKLRASMMIRCDLPDAPLDAGPKQLHYIAAIQHESEKDGTKTGGRQ